MLNKKVTFTKEKEHQMLADFWVVKEYSCGLSLIHARLN